MKDRTGHTGTPEGYGRDEYLGTDFAFGGAALIIAIAVITSDFDRFN